MGDQRNGGIAWCDETWNPIRGCSRVSPGCEHCYAETMAARFSDPGQPYHGLAKRSGRGLPKWTGEVRFVAEHLADPLRWKRPRRIFVNSMSDLFHEKLLSEEIAAIFGVMAAAPRHTFQVLTKRPERMREWFEWAATATCRDGRHAGPAAACLDEAAFTLSVDGLFPDAIAKADHDTWPLPNVILGVTAEDQQRWNERVPVLLDTPAALRMVSVEPQLEMVRSDVTWAPDTFIAPIDALKAAPGLPVIDWIITGGESGPGARAYDLAWARALKGQCETSGTAFFMKQTGANATDRGAAFRTKHHAGKDPGEWPADLQRQQFPEVAR